MSFKTKLQHAWKERQKEAHNRQIYLKELKARELAAERDAYARERVELAAARGRKKARPINWGAALAGFAGTPSSHPRTRTKNKTIRPKKKRRARSSRTDYDFDIADWGI